MKTQRESRITISNLSQEEAVALLATLKEEVMPSHIKPKYELDHPDPPNLNWCEKEYNAVNRAIENLDGWASEFGDYGEAQTKCEVFADVKRLRKEQAKVEQALRQLGLTVTKLEAAAKKLA